MHGKSSNRTYPLVLLHHVVVCGGQAGCVAVCEPQTEHHAPVLYVPRLGALPPCRSLHARAHKQARGKWHACITRMCCTHVPLPGTSLLNVGQVCCFASGQARQLCECAVQTRHLHHQPPQPPPPPTHTHTHTHTPPSPPHTHTHARKKDHHGEACCALKRS